MNMKKLLNLDYTLIEVFFCVIYAVVVNFASPILLDKGYTNTAIGIIIAAGSITTVIAQPIVAGFMDNHPQVSSFKVSIGVSALIAAFLAAIMAIARVSWVISFTFIGVITLYWAISPLLTTLCFKLSETGHHVNYGSARAFGSLAYAGACSLCGILTDHFGTNSLLLTGMISVIIFAFFMMLTEKHYKQAMQKVIVLDEQKEEEVEAVSYLDFIKHNFWFFAAMIGVTIFSYGNSITSNFAKQIISAIGGSDTDMGNILSFSALIELPILFTFDRIHTKVKCVTLLKISSIFYGIKMLAMYLAPNVFWYYVAQIFQLLQYPLFLAAIIAYVNEIMPKSEATRGQALYNMTANISSIIASFSAGFIIDNFGAHQTILVSLVFAVIGIIIFIPCINKVEQKRLSEIA